MISTALRSTALVVLACILIAVPVLGGARFSSAMYTAQSSNAPSSASAAVDWTPPTVDVVDPGTGLKDSVTITANAADGETGVANVVLQVQTPGASTWTTLCTSTSAPYRCTWNTAAIADGPYDLRAIATDRAGYATTSAKVRTTVSNAFGVTLGDPGEILRGSVALTATLLNASPLGLYSVRFEYAVAGSDNWKSVPLCLNILAPFSCSWLTTGVADGSYDLRVAATRLLTTTYSPVLTDVLVDNTAPAVTMLDPSTPLSGTVTLAATASDGGSGISAVAIQYAPNGTSTWTTICTPTQAPYSCRFNTMVAPRGAYSFRAVATDFAGNVTTSAIVANRMIDNTISSISLEDPGAHLAGTTSLSVNANSTAGVTSVTVQYAPAGTTGWAPICVLTGTPYTCAWNTQAVADGLYDLRALLIDGTGKQTVSTVLGGRRVDNTPVRGLDVQTANTTGIAGRLDTGDRITFTYSKAMSPASILPGWNGAATAATLRLRDGALLGTGSAGDTLDLLVGSTAVPLGSVNLRGDYIKSGKTSTATVTMVATTAMVNGTAVTVVTVTVGAPTNSGTLRTVTATGTMVWSPSGSATDLSGAPCSTAPVSESGALDREF
ncbi:Ig-like domain-containing protein [Microbacterium sp. MAHUQ-60]|uniref:Ig-like domain-containing protein n=1 Tax=unclassified Microbacterium TaxID=2609290 RepID=UPI00360DB5ED